MKHEQVVVDYWTMLKTSCACILLAISGYILLKMVQTIFYLPAHLKNNQKRLEELAAKYNLDLENELAQAEMNNDALLGQKENDIIKTNNDEDNDLLNEPKKVK